MHKSPMYACIVFLASGDAKRWKYVRDLHSFANFLSRRHSDWKYFNVYEKGSKRYLKRFYVGNAIPKVLSLVLFLAIVTLTQKFTFSIPLGPISWKNTFNKTTFSKPPLINDFNNTATIPTLENQKGGLEC